MSTLLAVILVACGVPLDDKPWWVFCADESGAYWVNAVTGKAVHDPKLARKKRKPVKLDPNSQLRVPPPEFLGRYEKPGVSEAKGVVVRELKNRLRLETKEKKSWLGAGRRPLVRPDGKAAVFQRWDGKSWNGKVRVEDLVLVDLATRKERVLLAKTAFQAIAWAPDGKTLAVGRAGRLDLVDPATAKITRTWKLADLDKRLWNHGAEGLAFRPDGKQLAARFVFLGGRTAGTKIFGDRTLFVLGLLFETPRQVKLTPTTCEGPLRAKAKP